MDAGDHYDAKARELGDQPAGERTPLQRFHNHAKRMLLAEFATGTGRLLDVACGRGGDLHKWRFLKVGEVVGLDVSGESVKEACARLEALGPGPPACTFRAHDLREEWPADLGTFGVVTCMFALHYFFETEGAAHAFIGRVAAHLEPGGHFVGVVPDARRVNELIKHGAFDNGVVRVRALWDGPPSPFGSAYTCSVQNTVTSESRAPEYLVYGSVLQKVAALYGLEPVPIKHPLFSRPARGGGVLHHLRPSYGGPEGECSSMYAGFAFRKKK